MFIAFKCDAVHLSFAGKVKRNLFGEDPHAEVFDQVFQNNTAAGVNLPGEQAGGALNHRCFQAHVVNGLRRFKTEQATADYGSCFRSLRVVPDRFQILDRAVNKNTGQVDALNRRYKWAGAGGENQVIVGTLPALLCGNHLMLSVDFDHAVPDKQLNTVFFIPLPGLDDQLIG